MDDTDWKTWTYIFGIAVVVCIYLIYTKQAEYDKTIAGHLEKIQKGEQKVALDAAEIKQLRSVIDNLKTHIADKDKQISQLRNITVYKDSQILVLKNKVVAIESTIKLHIDTIAKLQRDVIDLTNSKTSLESKNADLIRTNLDNTKKISDLTNQVNDAHVQIATLTAEKEALKQAKGLVDEEVVKLNIKISELSEQLNKSLEELNATKIANVEQYGKINELTTSNNNLTITVAKLQSTIESLQANKTALTSTKAQLELTINDLKTQNSTLKNEINQLNKQNASATIQIESHTKTISSLKENVVELTTELADKAAELQRQIVKTTELENDKVALLSKVNNLIKQLEQTKKDAVDVEASLSFRYSSNEIPIIKNIYNTYIDSKNNDLCQYNNKRLRELFNRTVDDINIRKCDNSFSVSNYLINKYGNQISSTEANMMDDLIKRGCDNSNFNRGHANGYLGMYESETCQPNTDLRRRFAMLQAEHLYASQNKFKEVIKRPIYQHTLNNTHQATLYLL